MFGGDGRWNCGLNAVSSDGDVVHVSVPAACVAGSGRMSFGGEAAGW